MKDTLPKSRSISTVRIPLKITSAYVIVGGLWILLSDKLLELLATDPGLFTKIAIIKGWFYVAGTGLMLYVLISRGILQIQRSEEEARLTEMKYRELVESANSIIMRRDITGRITFFNEFAQGFFGYSENEILGRNVVGTIVPELDGSGRNLREMIEDIGRHPERYANNENENMRRNGERVWIAWTNKPIRDEHGEITELLCVGNDITSRKRAEEGLRRYELLVAHSRDIIFFVRRDDGRILEANEAATRAYGYSREQLLAMTIHQLRAPETVGLIPEQMIEADLHGILLETVHRRRDGSTFPVEVSSRGETINGDRMLISVVRDITERKQAEEVLRISEERFRKLFEESPIGIAFLGKQREIILTNRRFRNFLGYSETEIIERGPVGLLHPDDWGPTMALSTRLRGGEIPLFHMEQRYLRKDGTVVWADTQIIVLRDRDGELIHTICWAQDITERKRVEEEIRESEHKYRVLFEAANDGIFLLDSTGYIDCNQRGADMYGRAREEVIGRSLRDFSPDRQPDGQLSPELSAVKMAAALNGEPQRFEWHSLRPDGMSFAVEVTLNRVEMGGSILLQAICRDITERKRAEDALRASEEQYRQVVLNAHDAIFIVQDGFVKFPNPQLSSLSSYSLEELARMTFVELVHPDDQELVTTTDQKRLQGEIVPHTYSFRLVNKLGKTLWVELSCVLFTWEGRPASLNFLRDITLETNLKSQLVHAQKMEAVGTLAGGIAHDFNNLLQAVQGYAEFLLLQRIQGEPGYRELHEILRAAKRGGELTRQLLTFSRRLEPRLQPVDLNRIVEDLRSMLARTIPKMIKIELHLTGHLHQVSADASQLEQILMNLAVNARDAMPTGGTLRIETKNVVLDEDGLCNQLGLPPGEYVLLAVRDTGQGMDRAILANVFDPFFTTKEIGRGTGLGLAIVYGIVKSHHGHIRCVSSPGEGTLFEIYLPVAKPPQKFPAIIKDTEVLRGGHETILLVDDDDSLRSLGKDILQAYGYTVQSTPDGESALKICEECGDRVGLVILDLIMPGMGGEQCLQKLLERNPAAKVVIASGCSWNGVTEKAAQSGAKAFIQKPYDVRQMLKVVRDVLDE